MLCGALCFATSNTIAKTVYSDGCSVMALFLVRGVAVYALNTSLEAMRRGRASAMQVATLRVGSKRLVKLNIARSTFGFIGISLLNISIQVMTLADAFALTLACITFMTFVFARIFLAELLSWQTLSGGGIATFGILLITQPAFLFGAGGRPPSLGGVLLSASSGTLLAVFNLLTRYLGRSPGGALGAAPSMLRLDQPPPAPRTASPSMLLSYYVVTIEICALLVALVTAILAPPTAVEWDWARLKVPDGLQNWGLIMLYCVTILIGQLLLATGFALLETARAATLNLTEICFAWLLDVTVLREPTSPLACFGTAGVFLGCALASMGAKPQAGAVAAPARRAAGSLASAGQQEVDEADWCEGGATLGMELSEQGGTGGDGDENKA